MMDSIILLQNDRKILNTINHNTKHLGTYNTVYIVIRNIKRQQRFCLFNLKTHTHL